jgi:hypothetical protein
MENRSFNTPHVICISKHHHHSGYDADSWNIFYKYMYVHVCIYIYIYTYVYIYVYIYMYILAIDAANNIRKQPAFDILVSKQDATNFTLKYC